MQVRATQEGGGNDTKLTPARASTAETRSAQTAGPGKSFRVFQEDEGQLKLVLFEPFPHYCDFKNAWKRGSEDKGQHRMANLLYALNLILVGSDLSVKDIIMFQEYLV